MRCLMSADNRHEQVAVVVAARVDDVRTHVLRSVC